MDKENKLDLHHAMLKVQYAGYFLHEIEEDILNKLNDAIQELHCSEEEMEDINDIDDHIEKARGEIEILANIFIDLGDDLDCLDYLKSIKQREELTKKTNTN